MGKCSDFSLYLITDRHQCGGRSLTDTVWAALDGGVTAVQLREKDLSSAVLYTLAAELRRLTAHYGARFLINDRIDIAAAVGADGVHLGINSLPLTTARGVAGAAMIIGYSAHAVAEALQAQRDGADFVTFSPVFDTPSKAPFGEPCGVSRLAEAVSVLDIPVIALGGISQINIVETLTTTVQGVAVISALLSATDPRCAAKALLNKIESYAQQR